MLSPQAWAAPEGLLSGLTELSRALIMAPAQARAVQDRDAMMQLRQALAQEKIGTMGQDLELKRGFLGVQQAQMDLAREKQANAPRQQLEKIAADKFMRAYTGVMSEVDPMTGEARTRRLTPAEKQQLFLDAEPFLPAEMQQRGRGLFFPSQPAQPAQPQAQAQGPGLDLGNAMGYLRKALGGGGAPAQQEVDIPLPTGDLQLPAAMLYPASVTEARAATPASGRTRTADAVDRLRLPKRKADAGR